MSVYDEIAAERSRQTSAWPDDHDAFIYAAVLAEECGEVARAIHDVRFARGEVEAVRREAVQVAAVAVQIAERIDSGRIRW